MNIKSLVQTLINRCGYQISRSPAARHGKHPFYDMQRFLGGGITILDVGANIGQSVNNFRRFFPAARIHSFEPSPTTYRLLQTNTSGLPGVTTWNFGLGAEPGKLTLLENSRSTMSSVLELGEAGWGNVERQTQVEIRTVDDFCAVEQIARVDILKSDTQGYDLQVFKGARRMMSENRIGMVLCEMIFDEIYRGMPNYHEVCGYLSEQDFALVSFYNMHFNQHNEALFCDALFVNKATHRKPASRLDSRTAAVDAPAGETR